MSSAMPVEARKKPKRTATIAGPALMEPPRSSTTRMIANSSTTDSEMATTDHTLGRSRSPGPEVRLRTPPPEPSCHQPALVMRQVTHRPAGFLDGTLPAHAGVPHHLTPYRNSTDHPYGEFRPLRFHAHTTRSQAFRIVAATTSAAASALTPRGLPTGPSQGDHRRARVPRKRIEGDIRVESPAGLMRCLVVMSRDKWGAQHGVSGTCRIRGVGPVTRPKRPSSRNTGYSQGTRDPNTGMTSRVLRKHTENARVPQMFYAASSPTRAARSCDHSPSFRRGLHD